MEPSGTVTMLNQSYYPEFYRTWLAKRESSAQVFRFWLSGRTAPTLLTIFEMPGGQQMQNEKIITHRAAAQASI